MHPAPSCRLQLHLTYHSADEYMRSPYHRPLGCYWLTWTKPLRLVFPIFSCNTSQVENGAGGWAMQMACSQKPCIRGKADAGTSWLCGSTEYLVLLSVVLPSTADCPGALGWCPGALVPWCRAALRRPDFLRFSSTVCMALILFFMVTATPGPKPQFSPPCSAVSNYFQDRQAPC